MNSLINLSVKKLFFRLEGETIHLTDEADANSIATAQICDQVTS